MRCAMRHAGRGGSELPFVGKRCDRFASASWPISPSELPFSRATSALRTAASFIEPKNGISFVSTIPICRMYSACEILPRATRDEMRRSCNFRNSMANSSKLALERRGRPNLICSSTFSRSAGRAVRARCSVYTLNLRFTRRPLASVHEPHIAAVVRQILVECHVGFLFLSCTPSKRERGHHLTP